MVFLAGAIAGGVVGVVAGALLQRRAGGSSIFEGRGLATTIALLALLVAAGALAAGARVRNDSGDSVPAASAVTTTTAGTAGTTATTATSSPSSRSSTTTHGPAGPTGLVTVPNVSNPPRTRTDAEAILKRAHLQVNVQSVPLSNVPPGYVLSQTPPPEAKTTAGSMVTLIVSAAA
jgi:PASTA domain